MSTLVINVRDGLAVERARLSGLFVYIGRKCYGYPASKWANPFKLAPKASDLERRRCLDYYLRHLNNRPDLMAAIPELRGKVLGCWCAPRLCHGHTLALLADEGTAQDTGEREG